LDFGLGGGIGDSERQLRHVVDSKRQQAGALHTLARISSHLNLAKRMECARLLALSTRRFGDIDQKISVSSKLKQRNKHKTKHT